MPHIYRSLAFIIVLPLLASAAEIADFPSDVHDLDMNKASGLMVRQRQGETLSSQDADYAELARAYMRSVQELRQRTRRGETLSAEETAFLPKANDAFRRRREASREAFVRENPPRDSTGPIPISDLKGLYKGEPGGLYQGKTNSPPKSHQTSGLSRAAAIQPLDESGRPSPDGKIVLVSVGMSNTTQEFRVFVEQANGDPDRNPALVIVDGAQGGQSAGITANPDAQYWTVTDTRLQEAEVTGNQVQAAWIKQGIPRPTEPFPAEAKKLQGYLEQTVQNLSDRYPNLKITYVSSRIYGGFAEADLNPEPHAYEGGFSTRWLISDQIAGKPELNHDPGRGPVRAPWLAWGPYLWADGLKRRSDGLFYTRDDLAGDGTHPSDLGRAKVADQLLRFFKSDPTASPWFLK